ncbi:unnamed protein product [Symbiodinium sp. CCMP2592]|nr:unnamed protein product [Symbiodinium sp. CCMP2592]
MADPLPWTPRPGLCATNFLGGLPGNGAVLRVPRPWRPAARDEAAGPFFSTRSAILAAVSWPSARRLCRRCLVLRKQQQGKVSFKDLLRSSEAPVEKASCAEWGCRCSLEGKLCPFTWRDYRRRHPAVGAISRWYERDGEELPEVFRAAEAPGYRTTGKMAIGPGRRGACVIGLFKKGGWKVVPVRDCQANHPAIVAAVHSLQEVLDELYGVVKPFNHDGPAKSISREGLLRYVEFSLERSSGLVQLVLVWNGRRGQDSPQLTKLLQKLWPQDAGNASFGAWHSIWVHWREPDPSLMRAIHSKKPEAWEQVRPSDAARSATSGEVVECLDGLSFAFGPASFRQPNLAVFEQILRDMKSSLCELVAGGAMQSSQHLRILELCGGVGVIGMSLADAVARMEEVGKVTLLSTDVNPNCAGPFQANAERNFGPEGREGLSLKFSALNASEALASLAGPEGGADVLVLDPPRRGLATRHWVQGLVGGEGEAASIRSSSVRVVIYMSCGHESFMADADRLTGRNPKADASFGPPFRLLSLRCYDMLPFTEHIETLGVFVREEVGDGKPPESVERDMLQISPEEKLQCQFLIGIEQDSEFNVRQRIFGERGHHMKIIAKRTGAKLRLRGLGSGFKEGPERVVSSDPLMLCVSSTDDQGHQEAVRLVEELLTGVHNQYRDFCSSTGRRIPALKVEVNHGPRPGSR